MMHWLVSKIIRVAGKWLDPIGFTLPEQFPSRTV